MKRLEYVYFTIYYHYSQRSYLPDSPFVRFKAMYLLSLSVGGWILLLQSLFLRFVKMAWFTSQGEAMLYALFVYTAITMVFHRVLIVKEHDQKIFNKFESYWTNNPNKKRDLVVAMIVTAVPYVLLVGMKIFFPR